MPTNADLGQAIRRLRRDRHLTIEALAFNAEMQPDLPVRDRARRACDLRGVLGAEERCGGRHMLDDWLAERATL
ncbi:MAG TPA: hypothetical protein VK272_05070 [Solirubrobacteraceae bacterium]|nr:hypothetical protein [Solirubrobacteraceae bacterium]